MGSKMLIDAAHPEETRVVVVRNKRIEDFDYESASRKQLRGNIYLAKVTRVEPSLQAAFVDYGGNRHGFLAFSEIHPDYYQIPVADRQALLEEEAEEQIQAEAEAAAEDESSAAVPAADPEPDGEPEAEIESLGGASGGFDAESDSDSGGEPGPERALASSDLDAIVSEDVHADDEHRHDAHPDDDHSDDDRPEDDHAGDAQEAAERAEGGERKRRRRRRGGKRFEEPENGRDTIDSVGSEDALEEVPERVRRRRRTYKIQEVIKRRQIILVQVVKEERGNKGAALTTYLSLAGRYTVLMPNTGRGGGISRKITGPSDRKRLRKIAGELEVPDGMGLIIRTAGASRTKAEVKRDYDYLLRLWENVRDLTLKSSAPTLVYEEGNLLKRSIRDLYNKDIDEILVAGDEAYKEAKDFMRMLMPSHAKNVKPYKEPEPVFVRYGVERQLSAMFSPYVTLRSGGYIVINQTEALVAIDVNSGKATREHNIEDTALKTNLEAAEEVSRQLRLRDLAGLIVIDFIDMDERRNNRAVERKLKECLRNERARIQVGRISHFGLLEMSRQRLRAGMLEGTTNACPMCQGAGIVRSTESVALDVLRSMEDMLITEGVSNLSATAPVDVALYILNQKRPILKDIESRYGISITVNADEALHGGNFHLEKAPGPLREPIAATAAPAPAAAAPAHPAEEIHDKDEAAASEGEGGRKRRRRRRRRRGERDAPEPIRATDYMDVEPYDDEEHDEAEADEMESGDAEVASDHAAEHGGERRRRRGRRGGRRDRGEPSSAFEHATETEADAEGPAEDDSEPAGEEASHHVAGTGEDGTPRARRRRRGRRGGRGRETVEPDRETGMDAIGAGGNGRGEDTSLETQTSLEAQAMPEPAARHSEAASDTLPDWERPAPRSDWQEPGPGQHAEPEPASPEPSPEESGPPRRGWWQRRFAGSSGS